MKIAITKIILDKNRIEYHLDYPFPIKPYLFSKKYFVEYENIDSLQDVDESILAIPMVSMLAPISWAIGVDLEIKKLDSTYFHAINEIKQVQRYFYPQFHSSGEIQVDKEVVNQFNGNRTGLLFSGGIDSITSWVRNKAQQPDLITVHGADYRIGEKASLKKMDECVQGFANKASAFSCTAKTDMRNINEILLGKEYKMPWYPNVAIGLLLTGLCAPITQVRNIGSLLISSGVTQDFKLPSGSDPRIDNKIAWADLKVIHDGYELSRQQKINFLAKSNMNYLTNLRICNVSAEKGNCLHCEKCYRTAVGLLLAGIDPKNCGLNINDQFLKYIRNSFEKGQISFNNDVVYMWHDIQENIPQNITDDKYGRKDFLTWVKGIDFVTYREKHKKNRLQVRIGDLLLFLREKRKKGLKWWFNAFYYSYLHLILKHLPGF